MTTIYALLEENQIRFIGKTTKVNLQEKLDQHLKEAVENPEKFGWISHLLNKGRAIEIKPMFTFSDEESPYYEKLFMNDFKFFIGRKMCSFEVSTPEIVIRELQTRNNSLQASL